MYKQYQLLQVFIVLFLVFSVYVTKLIHTAGIDEIMTFFKYTEHLSDVLTYDAPNNHILHSILVWLSTSIFGDSILAIRLPAFVSGILSLAFLYRLGKRWFNHCIGLTALVCMAITQSFFLYTVDGRGYTLTIVFTVLLIENLYLMREHTVNNRWVKTVLLSLGILFILPSNLYLIIPIIFVESTLDWFRFKRILWARALPYLFAIIVVVIYYGLALYVTFPSGLSREFDFGSYNINGFIVQTTLTLFNNPNISLVILVLFFLGVWFVFQRLRENLILPVIIFVFGGALVFCIIQWIVMNRLFFPRNFLYLLPLISIVSAIGLVELTRYHSGLIMICSFLILGLGLLGISSLQKNSHLQKWIDTIETNSLYADVILVSPAYYDPIYYELTYLGKGNRDYFMPTNDSNRFVFIPHLISFDEFVEIQELTHYVGKCGEEIWNSTTVITCSIQNAPYIKDKSRCFVSIYPYWRDCRPSERKK